MVHTQNFPNVWVVRSRIGLSCNSFFPDWVQESVGQEITNSHVDMFPRLDFWHFTRRERKGRKGFWHGKTLAKESETEKQVPLGYIRCDYLYRPSFRQYTFFFLYEHLFFLPSSFFFSDFSLICSYQRSWLFDYEN